MKKIYSVIILLSFWFTNRLNAQCATATTVPYLEDFEGITQTNEFPSCWTASSPSVSCLTFTSGPTFSGSKMAGFYYSPNGTNYIYSRLIHLNAGVTYSASVQCKTSGNGSSISWSNLALSYGPNQSAVGLTQIAAISGNVVLTTYSNLSNTFAVTSTGDYYIAINATGNNSGNDFFLYFDQLTVTTPCGLANNSPTLSLAVSQNPVCTGDIITYTVSGADFYSSPTGTSTATVYTMNPLLATSTFTVAGTRTLTGCSAVATVIFTVNPSPVVLAYSSMPAICNGESVNLMATGNAASYLWSYNQIIATSIVVSPTVTTVYTVTGSNASGCNSSAVCTVTVNPNPSFTLTSDPSPTVICYGESVEMSGNNNLSYQWSSPNDFLTGNPVTTTINVATVFTVTGTDINGCKTTVQYAMSGIVCGLGINENLTDGVYKMYPSPFYESIVIYSENNNAKNIEITDLSGKVVKALTSDQSEVSIDLSSCDRGVYYVRIRSEYKSSVMRIIKN